MNKQLKKRIQAKAIKSFSIPKGRYISVFTVEDSEYLLTYHDRKGNEYNHYLTLI